MLSDINKSILQHLTASCSATLGFIRIRFANALMDGKNLGLHANLQIQDWIQNKTRHFFGFLDYLDKFGIPLWYKTLATAANHILLHDNPNEKLVSKNWSRRWCNSHPQYKIVKEKPIEQAWQQTMNAVTIEKFYRKLGDTIKEHNIKKKDFWNMDETGVHIGVGRGQWVIVPDSDDGKERFTNIIGSHGDQEHVTVVEAISARGVVIPPLIIIKGKVILHK
jgi:hypothetical protein